jgi:predicted transcriptional regulator
MYNGLGGTMRTTIEISDEHRARLLELAARRREKGFSSLVGEAIDRYLEEKTALDERLEAALSVKGRLSAQDARTLEARATKLREAWR